MQKGKIINMKISVIIPVYNTEESYLRTGIYSAISQDLDDIEILLIDNGSDEKTVNILKDFEKKTSRIRLLYEPEGRQGKARNTGIMNAKGEYLYFLDSDDLLKPEALSSLYAIAKDNDLDILKTDYFLQDMLNNSISIRSILSNSPFHKIDSRKIYNNIINIRTCRSILYPSAFIWNGIYKKRFIQDNHIYFDEELIYQDQLFYFQTMIKANKIMFIDKALIYYRNYESSESKQVYERSMDMIKIYEKIETFLHHENLYEQYHDILKIIKIRSYIYFYNYLSENHIKKHYFENMSKCASELSEKDYIDFNENALLQLLLLKSGKYLLWEEYLEGKRRLITKFNLQIFRNELSKILKKFSNKRIFIFGGDDFALNILKDSNIREHNSFKGIIKTNDAKDQKAEDKYIFDINDIEKLLPDIIIPTKSSVEELGLLQAKKRLYALNFKLINIYQLKAY